MFEVYVTIADETCSYRQLRVGMLDGGSALQMGWRRGIQVLFVETHIPGVGHS